MSDRDEMFLEALTGLIDASNQKIMGQLNFVTEQLNARMDKLDARMDKLDEKIDMEIREIKIYIENVLEKKLNAFYDNTVTRPEFRKLEERVERIEKKIS